MLKNDLMRCKQLKMARVNERQAGLTLNKKRKEKMTRLLTISILLHVGFIIADMKQLIPIYHTFYLNVYKYNYEIKKKLTVKI